jgi:hypothetical protein
MTQRAYHAVVMTERDNRGLVECEMTVISPVDDETEVFMDLCERFGFDRVISFEPIGGARES